MTKQKRINEIVLASVSAILLIITTVLLLDKYSPNVVSIDSNAKNQIEDIIDKDYIGQYPNERELYEGQMRGFVSSLGDRYSYYMTEEEAGQFNKDIDEQYEGIGVQFRIDEGEYRIDKVFKNSPAQEYGIDTGDILYSVDNTSVLEFYDFDEIAEKIKGKPGTFVDLQFFRGDELMDFKVERRSVRIDPIQLVFKDSVAIITISSFGTGLDSAMNQVASEIINNKEVEKIILDLRGNTGGLLDQTIEVSSYFVKTDSIVVKEKTKEESSYLRSTTKDNTLQDYPIIVLTDKNTASASEIVTGCLRDNRGTMIIGQTTFGKGVVQQMYPLKDDGTLKLTIANWYTPNGDEIDQIGIVPDIRIRTIDDILEVVLNNYDWNTKTIK